MSAILVNARATVQLDFALNTIVKQVKFLDNYRDANTGKLMHAFDLDYIEFMYLPLDKMTKKHMELCDPYNNNCEPKYECKFDKESTCKNGIGRCFLGKYSFESKYNFPKSIKFLFTRD